MSEKKAMTWTDEQWQAMTIVDRDLLVAAAAGSGKTAVLVERIIRRITSDTEPLDVDRLLVATFTKAAADEMKQRIREALEEKLAEQPHSPALKKQLALIHRAAITTLHSFCLDVVRQYFQLIPIDPSFRIGNETEMELMRHDALEATFEHYYATSEDDSTFWQLVDAYSGEKSDEALFKLVLQLYDYSRSHPWPEHWLQSMAQSFAQPSGDGGQHVWFQQLLADVRLQCAAARQLLLEGLALAQHPQGPHPYVDNLTDDLQMVEELYETVCTGDWHSVYERFQHITFPRLKSIKAGEVDEHIQQQVRQRRDEVKKILQQLQEECFSRTPETYLAEMVHIAPLMATLVELVLAFGDAYREAKQAKNVVDFNDLEHYCLHILRDPQSTPEQLIPSAAALQYKQQFVEILLDEYQDTNEVQEAIVSLIARRDPGNRFMVGDVKQSIYRFRLAEPALFMHKYQIYRDVNDGEGAQVGTKIDLAKNFRSSREVVDGINFLFKQLMQPAVAEIDYDDKAALVYGATYLDVAKEDKPDRDIELLLIDRSAQHDNGGEGKAGFGEAGERQGVNGEVGDASDLEAVQLEARLIGAQIKKMMGGAGEPPYEVYDKQSGGMRPVTYRDFVILLRATKQWAPVMMEEFKQLGIPCYAELNTGYFSAGEVEIVLSLLQLIDNPLQDIPLAAVLRSPMYQLSADELAQIRVLSKGAPFYEAVAHYAAAAEVYNYPLQVKLKQFLAQLERWRMRAQQGALSELIWQIYRETGYYDIVGGMIGGVQRQANLRALYDRARQYEQTSLRGLFRFLRFIERMRDSGADLGTARALGEQEDVVSIVSIHRSKGLEYPIVFVAGLARQFNRQDLNGPFLIHKQLGFGPKIVDMARRVSYPSLPNIAIKRAVRMELLAEEMRILYVALTRAKEKLFLIGTVRDLDKHVERWAAALQTEGWALPEAMLARADRFLDWIGPALIRHPAAQVLHEQLSVPPAASALFTAEQSTWRVRVFAADRFAEPRQKRSERSDELRAALAQTKPVAMPATAHAQDIAARLAWAYPYRLAPTYFSKTSVSEMKRLELEQDELAASLLFERPLLRRPRFMEERKMTAAERGTLYHAVMQYMPLRKPMTAAHIEQALIEMVDKQFITSEQSEHVDPHLLLRFFTGEIGQRLLQATEVHREVPFSYGLPVRDVYPHADEQTGDETVLIQGVIDCLFAEGDQLILLDYKTDAVFGGQVALARIRERYALQMTLYAKAIEHIWQRPVKEKVLFLFDGGHVLTM